MQQQDSARQLDLLDRWSVAPFALPPGHGEPILSKPQ